MSNIFSVYRNSYLNARSDSINPQIINRCVDLARNEPTIDDGDYVPRWFRLCSEQPDLPTENVDLTRRPVAFGNWALPKLRRELHDEDVTVVIEALLSLSDLFRDPEKGYTALKLSIPDRLADKFEEDVPSVRELTAFVLGILAEYADGKETILKNDLLLQNLMLALGDALITVRHKAAVCVEMIARSWTAADVLVKAGLIELLLQILSNEEGSQITLLHLSTLRYLMYDCGKCIALKNDAFKIFVKYLDNESNEHITSALECLAILTSTKKGKLLALQKNLLLTLTRFLFYEDISTCTAAACVIMFCTVKTRAKFAAADIKTLSKRLIKLCTNPVNVRLQMFCLQALANICEHPAVRKEVRERYFDQLSQLQVDASIVYFKNTLLRVVAWHPQRSF